MDNLQQLRTNLNKAKKELHEFLGCQYIYQPNHKFYLLNHKWYTGTLNGWPSVNIEANGEYEEFVLDENQCRFDNNGYVTFFAYELNMTGHKLRHMRITLLKENENDTDSV